MTDEELAEFKKTINREIDFAIAEHGGMVHVHEMYTLMPGLIDYLAGWVTRSYWIQRQASLLKRVRPSLEETRRIYDLVRLKLDTGSSTS